MIRQTIEYVYDRLFPMPYEDTGETLTFQFKLTVVILLLANLITGLIVWMNHLPAGN